MLRPDEIAVSQARPNAADPASAVVLNRVSKSYGGLRVLVDIDFEVKLGQVTGLIGPNGAGKTTLFNVITGTQTQDAGELRYFGESVDRWPSWRRARKGISRTFQEVRLFASLTILDNVIVALQDNPGDRLVPAIFRWRSSNRADRKARNAATDLLASVGLAEFKDRLPSQLSYGQQKRASIARALATGTRLVCLDEPAAGLDPARTKEIVSLIRSIQSHASAVLIVEHNLELVSELCHEVAFLEMGRIVVTGPPDQVLKDDRVWQAFSGV